MNHPDEEQPVEEPTEAKSEATVSSQQEHDSTASSSESIANRGGNKIGPLKFCTLQDCMSVMSSWREDPPNTSDDDSDDASDLSFTDDEFKSAAVVLPNTNMSNSFKDGKATSASGTSNVDISVSASGSDYFNTPVTATASDVLAPTDRFIIKNNMSSEDAIQNDANATKRHSILTRIKRSLKKNPKFVNATSKLIGMTPGRLRFKQKDNGSYEPLDVVIRNISDSTVTYKLKRSDNILEVNQRMGVLKPLEMHKIAVSIKAGGKVNNNKLIAQVALLQDDQVKDKFQVSKFWKQLPAREIRQLVKVKCVPFVPGELINERASDLSDADTMSLMTLSSAISSQSSMVSGLLSGGNSTTLSPSASDKGKSDLTIPQQQQPKIHGTEMHITKSLDQIKNEIFGGPEKIPESSEKKPGEKPIRKSSKTKVFEQKLIRKKSEELVNAQPIAKGTAASDVSAQEKLKITKEIEKDNLVQENLKVPRNVQSPVSDGGDSLLDKLVANNMEPDDKEHLKVSSEVSKEMLHKEDLNANENIKKDPEVNDKEMETTNNLSHGEGKDDNPNSSDAPNAPKPKISHHPDPHEHDELPTFKQYPDTLSEEPREGTVDSKMPQLLEISAQTAFHATEFEGPAPEIPGIVDSHGRRQGQQLRSPRRHHEKDGNKEMKHESEPKLSMQEAHTDLHKLKQSFSHSESLGIDSGHLDMKALPVQQGFAPPKSEPFQTDESELEYEGATISNKPSVHIYRSAWSHSPTIPNQKFIKRDTSNRDLTKDYHGSESGPETMSTPKLTRNAPFYDFVMSHGQKNSANWQNSRSPSVASAYCVGHQYKIDQSPLTIQEGSNSSLGNTQSYEINDGEPQTITVTTHISTSNLQDSPRCSPRPVSPNKVKKNAYFEDSDDADSEEMDAIQWKRMKVKRNRQKIAQLTHNIITGFVFLIMWGMLLITSLMNSYRNGLCWEAPAEPEPSGLEWIANVLFRHAEI